MAVKQVQAKTFKKRVVDASTYDLARERLAAVFDRYDQISVSFSGGKDSTVCLHLALEMARETRRLPLTVVSFDEEAIPPETVEYMARVAAWPDIRFVWLCVPIQQRNACSEREPYFYPWAEEAREKWVRPLPPLGITDFPGFYRTGIGELMPVLFPPSRGTAATIMGIRTQESLSRFHAIASKAGTQSYLSVDPAAKHLVKVYPIYDWPLEDVWLAPKQFGWDYNRAYDVMEAAGLTRSNQRCAPPFGEQPIRRLFAYKTCWPELWSKMVNRVAGAATAARYANTELYGFGVSDDDLPRGLTWREYTLQTIRRLTPANQKEVALAIRSCVLIHRKEAGARPMPDAVPDPASGFCWKTLYLAAKIGANKFDRVLQKMANNAIKERRRYERQRAAGESHRMGATRRAP